MINAYMYFFIQCFLVGGHDVQLSVHFSSATNFYSTKTQKVLKVL